MRRSMFQSTNPALRHDEVWHQGISTPKTDTATVQGVVNKTSMLAMVAAIGGMLGIWVITNQPAVAFPLGIVGFIASLIAYFAIIFKPMRAKYLAWIYALVQGAFLGSITYFLDNTLKGMGYEAVGGLALQAFAITISVLIAMLALYYFDILKPIAPIFISFLNFTFLVSVTHIPTLSLNDLAFTPYKLSKLIKEFSIILIKILISFFFLFKSIRK